jgi:peroxiredoxin Q/BCP
MALEIGRKPPAFALPDEEGRTVKLSDFKGRRVVVFFYAKANTSG